MSTELIVALVSSCLTAIIGPIALQIFKNKLEKNGKDVLKDSLKTNTLVCNKIEEIKEHYKLDRVWITQFHNGGNFYPSGKSIQKFSMFYETLNRGAESIQQGFQNIPISLFSNPINYLLEENVLCISDFKDETVATHGLKYIAEENGCKSSYMFAIKTIDNKFIGVLGADYIRKKSLLTEDEITSLLVEASAIGGVLEAK